MPKIITDRLHSDLLIIVESLMDKVKGPQKSKIAGMYAELSKANTPPGYTD